MNMVKFTSAFALVLLLVLTATGLWAAGAEDEAAAAATEKAYVTDPTTGMQIAAPEYGGTFTYVWQHLSPVIDNYPTRHGQHNQGGVTEMLSIADWGIDRSVYDHKSRPTPLWAMKGQLAERWEQPDDTTIIFHIRRGVHWHDKEPMNGRELTPDDIVYNWQRYLGLGKWSEAGPISQFTSLPIESVTATDDWTVVFKLQRPQLTALAAILDDYPGHIQPPEVIEEHGGLHDWTQLVGTGLFELTDWVEDTSATWTKNPNYWNFDEKFPENRLPYVDEIRALVMTDAATRISALRTGQVDYLGWSGDVAITIDQMRALSKTNPELTFLPYAYRSNATSFAMDIDKEPFDDIRVRKAMQMALDLETINDSYFDGWAKWKPQGLVGDGAVDYFVPFDEWPEEVKKSYTYDPEGAEKLLDEAGYPRGADGVRFRTSLMSSTYFIDPALNDIAGSYWAKIGVEVEMSSPTDSAAFGAQIREHTYESGMVSSVMGYDRSPTLVMRVWAHSEGPVNGPGIRDPELDSLIEAAEQATTWEEQQRLIKEADGNVIANQYHIWFFKVPAFNAVQPWVVSYNGEYFLGFQQRYAQLFARVWIDSALKQEMGF